MNMIIATALGGSNISCSFESLFCHVLFI